MPPSGQVVLHTRAEDVPGFPSLLVAGLSYVGLLWYPEYTVYEEYADHGQEQYFCQVQILNIHGDWYEHGGQGVGITVDQAVHEAAYHALTLLCWDYPSLRAAASPFRDFPHALPGTEGVQRAVYPDLETIADPGHRVQAEMYEALDRRARLWREYTLASRMSHGHTLVQIQPLVESGAAPADLLPPLAIEVTSDKLPPHVHGVVPPRGPLIHPPPMLHGIRQSPYGRQPERVRRYPTPAKRIPYGYAGFY